MPRLALWRANYKIKKKKKNCQILSSHSSYYEEYCLLGCDCMESGTYVIPSLKNLLQPSFFRAENQAMGQNKQKRTIRYESM